MTVRELENRVSRSEFVEWMAFDDIEANRHEKLDYYLAQIAQVVQQPNLKRGVKTKVNDYLLRFKKGPGDKPIKLTGHQMAAVFKKLLGRKD